MPLVRQLLHAQEYWRVKDLRADVVILNEHPADYLDEVQSSSPELVQEPRWAGWLDKPGGMFLLRSDGMPEPDRHLLAAVARVVLRGDLGELSPQLDRPAPWLFAGRGSARDRPSCAAAAGPRRRHVPIPPLVMDNGIGGFTPDGREYVIVLDGDRETPLPVVERAGEPGVRHHPQRVGRRLHVGRQQPREPADAVRQRSDQRSRPAKRSTCATRSRGAVWGATPGPLPRGPDSPAAGWFGTRRASPATSTPSTGSSRSSPSSSRPTDPVKVALLTLTNTSTATRRLSVFGYVEWCLGPPRAGERRFVVTERRRSDRGDSGAKRLQHGVQGRVAFWHATRAAAIVHVRSRRVHRPQPDAGRAGRAVSRTTGRAQSAPDSIPAAHCRSRCDLPPGESRRVAFVLGQGRTARTAIELAARYASLADVDAALGTRDALLGRHARRDPGAARRTIRSICW